LIARFIKETHMSRSFWQAFPFGDKSARHLSASHHTKSTKQILVVEILESRDSPAILHPLYSFANDSGVIGPLATAGPTGLTPTQVRHAYGFDQIPLGDGSGMTIAIVAAYDNPNIVNDLHQFNLRFGLPDPVFTKVNQNGGSSMPAPDKGWAGEIALDVQWAHAIAPRANILLVEAFDASSANLFAAARYAASQPGVVVVSMSFGSAEFSGETSFDSSFRTPPGHGGVTFVAASGDTGAPASYPAASPNVLAVGGTTLYVDALGNTSSESAWTGSGGGLSAFEAQPSYQRGFVAQSTTQRGTPDVAYDADPNTGFPVYDSYSNGALTPWVQLGGTSAAAPQWSALIAIANQGRAAAGLGSLDGITQTLPKIYALPAADFRDITTGSSTGNPSLSAGPGYDLVTGRGSPIANRVVADLIGQPLSLSLNRFLVASSPSVTAGNSLSVTVTALDLSGALLSPYTGTVHLSSTDPAASLPADYTFTAANRGVHTFNVTLRTAGNQRVTVTDTATAVAGSTSVTVFPAAPSKLAFGQQPTNATANSLISPSVTVRVLDAFGNLVTADNTDRVTLALGNNPGGATLNGTTTVTVSGGTATFSNLSLNAAGVGYTLSARAGTLAGAVSSSFNVSAAAASQVIENFESNHTWNFTGSRGISAAISTAAAHDGARGLDDYSGEDWIYRTDADAQVRAGQSISTWLKFSGAADGRAYFAFGATPTGALSLVAAANSGQLILQNNTGYNFIDLAAASQSYQSNRWYRLEVNWGANGTIVGKLFDSNGTTLLRSVSALTTAITAGGFGFRSTGSDKFWDTVTRSNSASASAAPFEPVSTILAAPDLSPPSSWQSTLLALRDWLDDSPPTKLRQASHRDLARPTILSLDSWRVVSLDDRHTCG
jgi:hypothetical protein